MFQWPFEHWLYRLVTWLNLLSFPFCRFLPLGVIFWGMGTMGHRVPQYYIAILSMAMFVMSGINTVLFWRLFKNDIWRVYFRSGAAPSSKSSSRHMRGVAPATERDIAAPADGLSASSSTITTTITTKSAAVTTNGSVNNNGEVTSAASTTTTVHQRNGYVHHAHEHQE